MDITYNNGCYYRIYVREGFFVNSFCNWVNLHILYVNTRTRVSKLGYFYHTTAMENFSKLIQSGLNFVRKIASKLI